MNEYTDENLPERVNVFKVVSYDVSEVRDTLLMLHGDDPYYVPTYDEIMSHIEFSVRHDFSCEWGHTTSLRDLIFQDQDGNDL